MTEIWPGMCISSWDSQVTWRAYIIVEPIFNESLCLFLRTNGDEPRARKESIQQLGRYIAQVVQMAACEVHNLETRFESDVRYASIVQW